jgi:hypothetical protein
MRAKGAVTAEVSLEVEVDPSLAPALSTELQQIIEEIGLSASIQVERGARSRSSDERSID